MATYSWSVPTGNIITGNTYIKDTDNKIQDTIDDLADFVNSSGAYTGQGLMFDYVNKANNQTITGVKTFSNGIISNVTGTLTGNITGTAPKLATARTIYLAGDVTGSVSFDGSDNASITTTVGDDSHNHTIAYITGLQTALDGKLSTSGNATTATKLETPRKINGVNFDGSADINTFQTGMIMLWSGSSASIPDTWYLCNGSNGTPNLVDRFVVGAGSTYAVGATGGSANAVVVSHTHSASTDSQGSHTHSAWTDAQGSHTHGYNRAEGYTGGLGPYAGNGNPNYGTAKHYVDAAGEHGHNVGMSGAGAHGHNITVSTNGESGTNKNLPPYYALCYIMKG